MAHMAHNCDDLDDVELIVEATEPQKRFRAGPAVDQAEAERE